MLDTKKSIISWAFYDWAASSFSTTIMAGFFPLFFKAYWADPGDPGTSTLYLGITNSSSSFIIALLAPFFGAVADRGSTKKKFLMFFTYLGISMSSSLFLVHQGNWEMAIIFYCGASIGYAGGNIFYDSLITAVASKKKIDFVSILGYAFGYIGGGLLFLLNVLMYLYPDFFGMKDGSAAIRISFISVGIWWAVFSIPVFLFVNEPVYHKSESFLKTFRDGYRQLSNTLSEMRNLKVVGLFILAYWLYIDGVDTIIRMAIDYGMSLGFSPHSLIMALLMVQFIAFPSAIIYNWIAKKIGVKRAVLLAISGYCVVTILGYFMTSEFHFYIIAIIVGLFQGGLQALSRSLYSRIIPESKSAQFFGFYNMFGKFSVVLGPAIMGVITYISGNPRYGILSILMLFLLGGFFLYKIDFDEGERIARDYLA